MPQRNLFRVGSICDMTRKVLFISQEISPYTPDNEMALMGRQVPQLFQEGGCEIRTFMPKWGIVHERRGQLHEVIRLSGMNLIIDDTDHPLIIKVATIQGTRVQVYFIDNDDYFAKRLITCDENGNDYEDNGEKAIFFARGTLETVKKLRWVPDAIFCSGIMAAIVPMYIKTAYSDEPSYSTAKIITMLFSNSLHSPFEASFKKSLEFRSVKASTLKKYAPVFDYAELQKIAIDFSDALIIGSATLEPEIIAYAEASGKPLLKYVGESYKETYPDFLDNLLVT